MFQIIKHNGGIWGSLKTVFRTDELRKGTLVGIDKYGNKYYEDKSYFIGRSRFVDYNEDVFVNYDGSQVPAEWHGWLHYSTDVPPTKQQQTKHKWIVNHIENLSGTKHAYVPYSTTKQKIETWIPPKSK
ncbi:NDUFA12 (predicted) [Pycnogonum litorale]